MANWVGATGNWGIAANWSPATVPNGALADANINNGGTAALTGGQAFTVATLEITATSFVSIGDNSALTVATSIYNAGTILIGNSGNIAGLNIAGGSTVTLSGGGTIVMGGSTANDYIRDAAASTGKLINVDNLIQGVGHVGNGQLAFDNQAHGVINANIAGGALTVQPNSAGLTNHGILEATIGGNLVISGASLGQFGNSGGQILASGANSVVDLLGGVTVAGGLLNGSGGGVITTVGGGSATLDGSTQGAVTIAGAFVVNDNSSLQLKGTVSITGNLLVNSLGNFADLRIADGTTLTGGGSITLGAQLDNRLFGLSNAGTEVITNFNDNINGAGQLGVSNSIEFINQIGGIVNATSSTTSLIISPTAVVSVTAPRGGGFVNQGLLEATGAGGLVLNGGQFNNSGGQILASGAGNSVFLQVGVIISGGVINGGGGGVVTTVAGNTATLDGATQGAVTVAGNFVVRDNTRLNLKGSISITGSLQLGSTGNLTDILFADGVSLAGGGSIILSAQSTNRAFGFANSGAEVVTNVNTTISGAGQLGASNSIEFINQGGGVVDATSSAASLIISPTAVVSVTASHGGGFVNQGLLEATGGGGLVLNGGQFNNGGGQILANGAGSSVSLRAGVIISGGTLNGGAGGVVTTVAGNTATLDGSTQGAVTVSGNFVAHDNTTLNLNGAISITGSLLVASSGNLTDLRFANGTILGGGGSIILGAQATNRAFGFANSGAEVVTNFNTTISGAGLWGASNGFQFINQAGGVFEATSATVAMTLAASTVNDGVLEANGGTLVVQSAISGAGKAVVTANGKLQFQSAFNENVVFQGANAGTLGLSQAYGGVISGFNLGDTLDLPGIAYAAGEHMVLQATSSHVQTYALENASNAILGTFKFSGSYQNSYFTIGNVSGHVGLTLNHAPAPAPAIQDFNGDGISDVLLQNPASGQIGAWTVSGGAPTWHAFSTAAAGWRGVGTGDFDGNGTADVLLENVATGQIGAWLINNNAPTWVGFSTEAAGWHAAAIGDFDGNGTADVLLENTATGQIGAWLINNNAPTWVGFSTEASGWHVAGVGDYDGNGTADVLLENAATGQIGAWLINNNAPTWVGFSTEASGWHVAGVGDFDGNGTADVLLENLSTGQIGAWLINNNAPTWVGFSTEASGWHVAGVGDYNGDGNADVLLHNAATGQVGEWTIANNQPAWHGLSSALPGWSVS